MSPAHFFASACVAITLFLPLTAGPLRAQSAPAASPPCSAPEELLHLGQPLRRTGFAIANGEPVVIVALGSSSTAGAGASSPAHSYPSRLETELKVQFPGSPITVVNLGANGEDAKQMLERFNDVMRDKPDLVLWQVGTNAVLRDYPVAGEAPLFREGIRLLKAAQSDIVLVDSQYAPKVLAKPDIGSMLDLLANTARDERIGLFRRFAIMKDWHDKQGISFDTVLSPDGLHMNDWSYRCIAKLLSVAIVDAVRNPAIPALARAPARPR
jgi:lysophospholipase L1-like esterase